MGDYLKLSLASIERATRIVKGGTIDLYENLCEFLVWKGLVATEDFLLRKYEHLSDHLHTRRDQHNLRVVLLQLYSVVKQGETLVHKCCGSQNVATSWPGRVLPLLGFKEDVIDIVVHLRWWESIIDMVMISQDEVRHGGELEQVKRASQQFEQTLERFLTSSNDNELQGAADLDTELLRRKIEELQGSYSGQPGTREAYLLSLQVESLLTDRDVSEVSGLNEYNFKKVIGNGGFGAVLHVDWFGFDCALKMFTKLPARDEAESLKRCHHPRIVQCYRQWEPVNSENQTHMLMERMPTDLQTYMTKAVKGGTSSSSPSSPSSSGSASVSGSAPFSDPVAIDIMMQVAQAMWHMHSRNVIHRDLKPLNVLVREVSVDEVPELCEQGFLHVKLGDFGLARDNMMSSNDHHLSLNAGSSLYRAPELSSPEYVSGRNYPRKADVWSFGVMCAVLLTGRHPFSEIKLTMGELKRRLENNEIRPLLPDACPDYLKACIEGCWEHDPKDRPRFSEIWKVLRFAKLRSLGLLQHNYDLFTFRDFRHRPPINPSPPSVTPQRPLLQTVPEVSVQPSLTSRFATLISETIVWKRIVSAFGQEPINQHTLQRPTSGSGPSVHRSEDNPLGYLVNLVLPLESEVNSKLDVIFFEGNVGRRKHLSCKDTWVQRGKSDVWWPRDWLAKDFKDDIRVLLLEYTFSKDDFSDKRKEAIDVVVDDLETLLVFRDRWNRERTWERPIVLVGHSLGCIVIEQLVVALDRRARALEVLNDGMDIDRAKLSKAFLSSLAGCFFYAPPLKGLEPSEDLLKYVFGGLNYSKALFTDLRSDSLKVRQLSEEFTRARSEKVKLIALTEGDHTRGRKVVPPGSMQDFGGTVKELEDSNHSDTCKPTNKEHLAYSKLVEFIKDIL